jgi:chromosome partitioning protein
MSRMRYTLSAGEMCRLLDRDLAAIAWPSSPPGPTDRLSPSVVREVRRASGVTAPFRVVAVMNLKGGVGKTTSVVTIASRAVQYGFRTCVLDLDAQASATLALGVEPAEGDLIFRDVWAAPAETVPKALHEVQEFFSLLPSALENSVLDVELVRPASQKAAVAAVCDVLGTLGFDLVVVDCPPSLGAASISAACAADTVLVPAGNDAFSLRGIELTMEEVAAIRKTFGLGPVDVRLLCTMVDGRETLSARYPAELAERYGEQLLPGVVRRSTEFSKALERRETIFAAQGRSGPKTDYDRATRALLGLGVGGTDG